MEKLPHFEVLSLIVIFAIVRENNRCAKNVLLLNHVNPIPKK